MSSLFAEHGWTLALAALGSILVAAVGGWLTDIGEWYFGLRMPAWKPPNWIFGPVWTVILTLAAISAALAWAAADTSQQRRWIIALFGLNAACNIGWNILFFTLRRPDWAMIETVALWGSILALILFLWPLSAVAALLLVPYLIWVTIAAKLTADIVKLNAPFPGRA